MSTASWQNPHVTQAEIIRAEARILARGRLREAILDEARRQSVASGWAGMRMGVLAAQVGVSRQTLHNEFGTKQALGQALVLREADALIGAVLQAYAEPGGDVQAAMAGAATLALQLLAANELLADVVAARDVSLLPMLTSRSRPLLERATAALSERVAADRPELDRDSVQRNVDVLVRLVISYALLPGQEPQILGPLLARVFEGSVVGSCQR